MKMGLFPLFSLEKVEIYVPTAYKKHQKYVNVKKRVFYYILKNLELQQICKSALLWLAKYSIRQKKH